MRQNVKHKNQNDTSQINARKPKIRSKHSSIHQELNLRVGMDRKARMYSCDQCTYQTRYKSYLIRHKKGHENICNFKCTMCGKEFKLKDDLKQHEQIVHKSNNDDECNTDNKPRTYPCNQCAYQAKYKSYLIRHKERHEDIRKFECSMCGMRFKRKSDLKRHEAKHRRNRKVKCTICGKRFKTKNNLKQHEVKHGIKHNFKCTNCGKKFKWKQILLRHIKNTHI